jgi:regulator of sigma E protease
MSEKKHLLSRWFRAFLGIIVFVAVIYVVIQNAGAFGKVVLVLLGFGAVVLVHEFGHFVVAKLCGVRVEAFSIFMPPLLVGVRKTEKGVRFRILPELFHKEDDQSGEGLLSFTIGPVRIPTSRDSSNGVGKKNSVSGPAAASRDTGRGSGTEYRIGLIPFGGFVKMLGQDDIGPVKTSNDPHSFANKPFIVRAPVLAAGVLFNALSAVVIFMIVFLVGINLTPAVVGEVKPNSPAARAGLKAGDEIIEIAGKSDNLDFSNIGVAAALSDVNEAVRLKVKHEDGSVEDFALAAEQQPGDMMRTFGILPPTSLTVAELSDDDANDLYTRTGLLAGDRIKSVGGKDVQTYWGLMEIVQNTLAPEATLLAERIKKSGEVEQIKSQVRLDLSPGGRQEVRSESELGHIYSMVPRLRVTAVMDVPEQAEAGSLLSRFKNKILSLFGKAATEQAKTDTPSDIRRGDIIVAIGEVENPTYKEMREITEKHEGKELAISVLRTGGGGVEQTVGVTVVPKRPPGGDRALIGIGVVLDAEHAVVAKTVDMEGGPAKLEIPRGAVITAVDGTPVSSFYDIIREIVRYSGEQITIDYRLDQMVAGDVALNVGSSKEFVTVEAAFAEYIPFEGLKRPYKARGGDLPSRLFDAVAMGCEKMIMFIAQTYVTLKRIIGGLVSPRSLMGPVGIIVFSYRIVAEQPLIYYVYFLGLISAVIAVFNFLPLPPFDGGLVVLLLVEKIKGSALSERTQGVIIYAGWVLIGALFVYVTFNDIIRSLFG